jgi:probable HAF family extracellular repeat protein
MTKVLTIMLAAALVTACSESTPPLPPSIRTIHVSASTSSLVLGDSLEVRATATAADGSAVALGNVAWTSNNIAVATVTATGPLTAEVRTISAGSVFITATVESHSGQLALAVTAPALPPLQTSPSLAFIWSRETGMVALTLPAGAHESKAAAINDLGQVVGYVGIGQSYHAFVWTLAGGMVDIGGLPESVSSYATAINNAGQVAGYSRDASGHNRAFRWSASEGMIALDVLPGTVNSYAEGINSSGKVVGERDGSPFRWSQDKGMEDLGLFGTDSDGGAMAISDNGDIVGYSGDGGYYGITRAVLWSADGTKKIIDICTTGSPFYGCYSSANGINSAGQIAVNSESGGPSNAFRLTPGVDREYIFGLPGSHLSYARGINEAGQVVGFSEGSSFALALGRAFLWSPTDGAIDLGVLTGRHWSDATGINNHGQVVGISF